MKRFAANVLLIGALCVGAAGLFSPLLSVSLPPLISIAFADDDSRTLEERRMERGYILRENAKDNAREGLGYEPVPPGLNVRNIDYFTLSQQIRRLGAMVRELSATMDPAAIIPPSGRTLIPGGDALAIHGPEGPTTRSVKLILEYRLLLAGNPRLVVGDVSDDGTAVHAHVVTRDGSLVEAYRIDKKSGAWEPVR